MKNALLVLLMLLFLSLFTTAISSNEAVNFVVNENNYLIEGENFKTPIATISDSTASYWIVPVLSGETIITFFPVKENTKELEESRAKNRDLFKTADTLRELVAEKERVSQNPAVDWIFTSTYTLLFDTLALSLNSEVFQLNTISTELDESQITSNVGLLNNGLLSMSGKAGKISTLINEAVLAENNFNTEPSVVKVNDLKEKFDAVFLELEKLNEEALSYRTEINKLKERISVSDKEASTKTYLIALADPPSEFNSIGNYLIDGTELSSGIDSVYSRVNSRQDVLLDTFDSRLQRNFVYSLLFEQNQEAIRATDNELSSIKDLTEFILSDKNRPFWKARSSLVVLESNWNLAEKSFNEKNYKNVELEAKKALGEALKIYRQGFVEPTLEPPIFSNETIFQIVTALVVLLVVIFAYNNRDKIIGDANKNEKEEEVEIGGF